MTSSPHASTQFAASPRRRVTPSGYRRVAPSGHRRVAAPVLAAALGVAACGRPAAKPAAAPVDERIIAANWVNSTFAALTLEEKVGQLLLTPAPANLSDTTTVDYQRLLHSIRDLHISAVSVSNASSPDIAAQLNALQHAAKVPLLFAAAADYRADDALFPSFLGIGATGEPVFADTLARVTVRQARAFGINWVFSPALRSFGSDSATSAVFVRAYMHGASAAGALTSDLTTVAAQQLPAASAGDAAVATILAGNDIVSAPTDVDAAFNALLAAVKAGRIPLVRVDGTVRRILTAKARAGLYKTRYATPDLRAGTVAPPQPTRTATLIAARALVLLRDSANVIPVDPRSHRAAAVVAFTSVTDVTGGRALAAELRRIYGNATAVRLDETSSPAAVDSALASARAADFTVYATFIEPRPEQGTPRLPALAHAVAARLRSEGRQLITIAFGDPASSADLPGASTYMLAWQTRATASQIAAAQAVAGMTNISGHLPIDLGEAARGSGLTRIAPRYVLTFGRAEDVGMDAARLARLDNIISTAIADHATPGASVAVGRYGRIVKMQGYGDVDYRTGFPAVTDSTMYDLASLTKVAGTTNAVMILYDEGKIELDAPISQYLSEWRGGGECPELTIGMPAPPPDGNCRGLSTEKSRITVRQLLTHSAGLRAWAPLYSTARGRARFIEDIAKLPLEYLPGTRSLYSDLSMIVAQAIVERVSGEPLDQFLQKRLFDPMGMRDTRFNPVRAPDEPDTLGCLAGITPDPAVLARIAPTEINSRGLQIYGTVHDENACAIGGVSGHAGLFSSARDLAALSQMLLDDGFYAGHRLIRPSTVDLFTSRQETRSSRALGWDTPAFGASNGDYFSEHSFGHTGFTGTSIWVDKDRQVFVVLLTNRVNPSSSNEKHLALRRAVQDAVALAVLDMPIAKRPDVIEGERQRAIARAAAEKERKRALRARRARQRSSAKRNTSRQSSVGKKKSSTKKPTPKKSTAKKKQTPRKQ